MHPKAFALAAALALAAAPVTAQQLVRVTDPANPIVSDTGEGCGVFWLDLVGDGRLDLFVANGNGVAMKNALYRNTREGGGFVRVVTGAIATDSMSASGVTAGDYDRDGLLDLFVCERFSHGNRLYRGVGDTLFERVSGEPPVADLASSNCASWVDVDGDGQLDLAVVNFSQTDFLYRNGGPPGFHFTRIDTTGLTSGLDQSIVGVWGDPDGDGRDDLFVGVGGRQNDDLYTNHGGLYFTRSAITDGRATLGASWGDWDDDGHPDLVTCGYSNTPSILYHNAGPPTFALVPVAGSPISATAANWVGSAWGDVDDDGDLDLLIAGDGGPSMLFLNGGPPGYAFTRVTTGAIATDAGNAFGCAFGDYDRDGRLDLVIAHRAGQTNALYHNEGGTNHWLNVRCRGTVSNTSAIGAKLTVYATIADAPRAQHREVTSQTGYNSGNLDQHFGLGDATAIDSVVVRWPAGGVETWRLLPADTFVVLVEGGAPPLAVPVCTPPAVLVLAPAGAQPAHGAMRVRFTLPDAGRTRLELFDVAGRRLATPLDAWRAAGTYELAVDAGAHAGVVLARLTAGGRVATTRLVRLR